MEKKYNVVVQALEKHIKRRPAPLRSVKVEDSPGGI